MTLKWGLILTITAGLLTADAAPRILVHGHRGARAVRPENTLPAFEYAIGAGADVLELDLAVTKDNILVVSHDPLMNAKLCTGPRSDAPIHQLTLREIQQFDCGALKSTEFPNQRSVPGTRMPTLDEVFALAPKGTFEFNIETKIFLDKPLLAPSPAAFADLVVAAIRKHKLESRVIVQSFDFRTLHEVKKLAPEIRLSALYASKARPFVAIATEANARIISPHFTLVTKEQVDLAHKAGLQVIPWTANAPAEWKPLVDAGVDAIITDDPAALIAYLKNHVVK